MLMGVISGGLRSFALTCRLVAVTDALLGMFNIDLLLRLLCRHLLPPLLLLPVLQHVVGC
jgi:hypothetical protein